MTFEVRWDRKAADFLRKQDKFISSRIEKKVDEIKSDPLQHLEQPASSKAYKSAFPPLYSLVVDNEVQT